MARCASGRRLRQAELSATFTANTPATSLANAPGTRSPTASAAACSRLSRLSNQIPSSSAEASARSLAGTVSSLRPSYAKSCRRTSPARPCSRRRIPKKRSFTEVTTMPPITSLATKLQRDFPEIRFAPGETFAWQPQEKAVRYVAASGDLPALLHETAHAQLGHHEYVRDIALLRMEREAWQYAKETLAAKYAVEITEDDIEEALDTYRD